MTQAYECDGTTGASPVRCVLVEDNSEVLAATKALLELEGMGVVATANTGVGALEAIEALSPTVVVLDLRLPDLSGLEVARLAAEIARRKVAVVLHTSYPGRDVVPAALDAGASGVVVKGSSPEKLLEAIVAVASGGVWIDPVLLDDPPPS